MASDDLSPQMRTTLRAIANRPGNYAASYPGGLRTIKSLKARGLVRAQRETWEGVTVDAIYPTAPGFRIAQGGDRSLREVGR